MNETLLRFIASCSHKYYEENLADLDHHQISTDWWSAFDFLLSRIIYQGRSDEMSWKVYCAAQDVLIPHFQGSERDLTFTLQRQDDWKTLKAALEAKIGPRKVGKARDIQMILSALRFVDRLPNRNIVAYSITKLQAGQLLDHYQELMGESTNGITQVGPKVAALYLRDLVTLYDLADLVNDDSAFCLQPIDTWVRKIARKLKVVDEEADDPTIQRAIVTACRESGVNAFRFNQGAWYLGYNSLDLLLGLPDAAFELGNRMLVEKGVSK